MTSLLQRFLSAVDATPPVLSMDEYVSIAKQRQQDVLDGDRFLASYPRRGNTWIRAAQVAESR